MPARDAGLAVIIASAGRPAALHETVLSVLRQRRLPGQLLVSIPGDDHILAETRALPGVMPVLSEIGLTRQRNRAVAALAPDIALVSFLDDDVELQEDYLDCIAAAFAADPMAILADGRVLADGAAKGPITRAYASAIMARANGASRSVQAIGPEHAYGCNMSVRRGVFRTASFDERIPLYGYMEDRDFAYQCARMGRLLRCEGARLVHLGIASGRVSGKRFGFSQVMNPLYLWRKGHYRSRRDVIRQISQPLLVNAALALAPRQRVDRRGRFIGNCRALATALRGRIAPEDILRL